jgi:hypothetical protein
MLREFVTDYRERRRMVGHIFDNAEAWLHEYDHQKLAHQGEQP